MKTILLHYLAKNGMLVAWNLLDCSRLWVAKQWNISCNYVCSTKNRWTWIACTE